MKCLVSSLLFLFVACAAAFCQQSESLGIIGVGAESGVRITEIISGGPASSAGLKVDDLLLTIDGKQLKKSDERFELMTSKAAGSRLLIKYSRQGHDATATLVLGAASMESSRPSEQKPVEKPPVKPAINLSDSFARAALFALRGITSDASTPSFQSGVMMVDQHTSELLQAADVEIASNAEKEALGFLQVFWMAHLNDNTVTNIMRIKYEDHILVQGIGGTRVPSYLVKTYASEAVRNDPRFIEMSGRETACSLAIENRLRGRTWNNPSTDECDPSAERYQESVR